MASAAAVPVRICAVPIVRVVKLAPDFSLIVIRQRPAGKSGKSGLLRADPLYMRP
jgi:hypothetical protein